MSKVYGWKLEMRLSECSICALFPVDTRRRLTVGDSDVLCVTVEPVHEGVGLSHLGGRANKAITEMASMEEV